MPELDINGFPHGVRILCSRNVTSSIQSSKYLQQAHVHFFVDFHGTVVDNLLKGHPSCDSTRTLLLYSGYLIWPWRPAPSSCSICQGFLLSTTMAGGVYKENLAQIGVSVRCVFLKVCILASGAIQTLDILHWSTSSRASRSDVGLTLSPVECRPPSH